MASTTVKFGAEYSDVTTALSEMGHGVKEFGHELHSAERMAHRFSGVISALAGESGEAGKALGSLAAGLAIGGPAGLAIGAMAALVEHFKEAKKEAKELAKEGAKSMQELGREIENTNRKLHDLKPLSSKEFELRDLLELRNQIQALKAEQGELSAADENGFLSYSSVEKARELSSEIGELEEKYKKLTKGQGDDYTGKLALAVSGERSLDQHKEELDEKKKDDDLARQEDKEADQAYYQTKTLLAEAQLDQVQKLKDEFGVKDEQLQDKIAEATDARLRNNLEAERSALKGLYDFRVTEAQRALEKEFQDAAEAERKHEEEKARHMAEGTKRAIEEMRRYDAEVARVAKEMASPYVSAARGVMSAFRSAFEDILRGGKSFAEIMSSLFLNLANVALGIVEDLAMKSVEKLIEAQFMDQATKSVEAQRAVGLTFANTMASVSAIPVVGPFMAPGVAASNMALAETGAGMASAAGGWDIPWHIDPVTQLHGGEKVLPRKQAAVIDSLANGAGAVAQQPIQVHFNISAMDGRDVYRTLTNNQTDLIRVINEAQRNGRIRP